MKCSLVYLLRALGLLPQCFHIFERCLLKALSLLPQLLLQPAKTPPEFAVSFAQRRFRIDREIAGNIYQHKKQVTYFIFNTAAQLFRDLQLASCFESFSGKFIDICAEFMSLFGELLKESLNLRPVKTHMRSFGTDLLGFHERGHFAGDSA